MNAQRRKRIADLLDRLSALKTDLEILRDEEQDSLDNLPDSIQTSERGEKMDTAIQSLEEAIDSVDQIESALEEASA